MKDSGFLNRLSRFKSRPGYHSGNANLGTADADILVADGYWHFSTVAGFAVGLAYGKHIPESIVVGLSYDGGNLD